MTNNAVQSATYSDLKVIKSRGQFQIVLEAPLEQMARFVEMFGAPCPGAEIPVAVARLVAPVAEPKRTNEAASERGRLAYATAGERERAVTRAALLCGDPAFQAWAGVKGDEAATVRFLRRKLEVQSRGEIASSDEAYRKFIALELEYRQAHGLEAERRG